MRPHFLLGGVQIGFRVSGGPRHGFRRAVGKVSLEQACEAPSSQRGQGQAQEPLHVHGA